MYQCGFEQTEYIYNNNNNLYFVHFPMKANGIGLSSLESPIRYYFDNINACDRLLFFILEMFY